MTRTFINGLSLSCLLAAALGAAEPGYVWVEAESASDKLQQPNDWYDPVDRKTSLSGQDWWHSFDETGMKSGYALCPFDLPRAGSWRPWVRLNLSSTGYTWAIDGAAAQELPLAAWQKADKDNEGNLAYEPRIHDIAYASHDGSNRHRLIWVRLDEMTLAAGAHSLRLAVQPGKDGKGFASVDCFVLAERGFAFRPRLFYKPEEKLRSTPELDPARTWAWPATRDTFSDSPLDLRRLNETVAGEHGFIKLAADGESFLRGDGQPIRFWSGSDYSWRAPFKRGVGKVSEAAAQTVAHQARWLAKRGINMVRFHGHLPPEDKRDGPAVTRDSINEVDLHGAWYMVAAFKKEGIYSTISPYWGSSTENLPGWDLGFKGGKLSGLLFFYEPVQAMYRAWIRRLYTEVNPYTGIALRDDPAVAIMQLQNEDSLLFYTASTIGGEPLRVLTKKFGDFVAAKHGSVAKALELYTLKYESAWDLRGSDDVAAGTVAILQNWYFTGDARDRAKKWEVPGTRARLNDQLAFFSTLMRDFNIQTTRYLREELGCKQLINAGNWKSVDPLTADDAERWSYTANEVIGKNAYFNGIHNGINNGWQILAQHVYTSWSATQRPRYWPMNVKQVAGHPFIIPESLWVPPNLYQAEGPLMVAAQLSLTGVDSFYWFAGGDGEWGNVDSKWSYDSPMLLGQFPATALAFRQGYIAQAAAPVVVEERSDDDVFNQRTPLISEAEVYDPNRDAGAMSTESTVRTAQDPLAFCVGPVRVRYGGDARNNRVLEQLPKLIDTKASLLHSVTGEITTDYATGIYTVNAPRCQAAAGFLGKRPEIVLKDLRIRCRNDYASIVVVPLDGQPLATAKRVLVQVGTVARPTGWVARERSIDNGGTLYDGFQILRKGSAPWQIANTEAEVTLANPGLVSASVLDINGLPTGAHPALRREGGSVSLSLPADALYTVRVRRPAMLLPRLATLILLGAALGAAEDDFATSRKALRATLKTASLEAAAVAPFEALLKLAATPEQRGEATSMLAEALGKAGQHERAAAQWGAYAELARQGQQDDRAQRVWHGEFSRLRSLEKIKPLPGAQLSALAQQTLARNDPELTVAQKLELVGLALRGLQAGTDGAATLAWISGLAAGAGNEDGYRIALLLIQAETQVQAKALHEGLAVFDRVLADPQTKPEQRCRALCRKAYALGVNRRGHEALPDLARLVQAVPLAVQAGWAPGREDLKNLRGAADLARNQGDLAQAEAILGLFTICSKDQSTILWAQMELATLLRLQDRSAEAEAVYVGIMAGSDARLAGEAQLSRAFLVCGDLLDAGRGLPLVEEALRNEKIPLRPRGEALMKYARLVLAAGDRPAALSWFARVETLPGGGAEQPRLLSQALVGMGQVAESQGDNQAAKAYYQRALDLSEGDNDARIRARDALEGIRYFE